jgi:hypothetical protein
MMYANSKIELKKKEQAEIFDSGQDRAIGVRFLLPPEANV